MTYDELIFNTKWLPMKWPSKMPCCHFVQVCLSSDDIVFGVTKLGKVFHWEFKTYWTTQPKIKMSHQLISIRFAQFFFHFLVSCNDSDRLSIFAFTKHSLHSFNSEASLSALVPPRFLFFNFTPESLFTQSWSLPFYSLLKYFLF